MNSYQNSAKMNSTNREAGQVNLTAITWAHAVNSQKLLTDALNSSVDFIEADIVLGKINDSGADTPIMAHPPAKSSDLTLESFLSQINDHNAKCIDKMKGVKLDFKTIEAFEGALKTLKAKTTQMNYPIWLNADIIKGPISQTTTVPVNPEQFFAGCAEFQAAVLSIGWTTNWTSSVNNGSYRREETNAMLDAIKNNNITHSGQSITFPVRAGIAANSLNELQDLLKDLSDTNDCTLTIWSSQYDFVDIDKLRKLIFSVGLDRVYLDVPKELSCQLNLSQPDHLNGGNDENLRRNP